MKKTNKNKIEILNKKLSEKPNFISTNQIFDKIFELSRDSQILDKILKHNVSEIDRFINNQAKLKRRFSTKFREFYENKYIIYPPRVNCEQSSSEATARYKAGIIAELIKEINEAQTVTQTDNTNQVNFNQLNEKELTLLDATCGFGIDTLHFAKIKSNFNRSQSIKVIGLDKNLDLININEHNRKQLKIDNLQFINLDFEKYLESKEAGALGSKFDVIYVDPSRRDYNGNKVFILSDLEPDILKLMEKIKSKTDFLFVKLSPLIDIQYLIKTFENLRSIHLVEYDNELKEVLILLDLKQKLLSDSNLTVSNLNNINIHLVQIKDEDNTSNQNIVENTFEISQNTNFNLSNMKYSEPLELIYEPSVAELKLGYWDLFQSFHKIAPNTHYFTLTNETYNQNNIGEIRNHRSFLGKFYRIIKTTKLDKNELESLNIRKANIKVRNAKIKVEDAYKTLKIKSGGDFYIFIFNDQNSKMQMVITVKIK